MVCLRLRSHVSAHTTRSTKKKTNESFWYCAWCLRTHVIAGAGRHFPVLLPPSTLHTRQKVLKTEQIWTSIRGWTKSKILVRKTTRWTKHGCSFLADITRTKGSKSRKGIIAVESTRAGYLVEGAFLRPEKGLRTERPRLAQICEGHKEPNTWVEDAFY